VKRGAWHQLGNRSQKVVLEQFQNNIGVGAIISPRDLTLDNAEDYAHQYRAMGVDLIVDSQFHIPDFTNRELSSYGLDEYRTTASTLNLLSGYELDSLSSTLESINRRLGTTAVLAPAVVYEAGRPDLMDFNAGLFAAAKRVGDALGRPTYGTVIIGRSAATASQTTDPIVASATALAADGWYYGFEFDQERIPTSEPAVLRACETGLTLAMTGLPVLHAFAGPLGLLSLCFGATAAGIGHSQNLWKFTPSRWQQNDGSGGGGNAPARFFSRALWGTVIVPDEIVRFNTALRTLVLTPSPFATAAIQNPTVPWDKWVANKHLVAVIARTVDEMASVSTPRECATAAASILDEAIGLHTTIAAQMRLADNTSAYQRPWRRALATLLNTRGTDYDFLELLS